MSADDETDVWAPWAYEDPYDCIALDPPWLERGAGKSKRGADRHYPLVRTECMPELIIGSGYWRPSRDAHMYMWVTNNFLEDGLWLMGVLGFRYITNLPWVKLTSNEQRILEATGMLEAGMPTERALAKMLVSGIGQYFRGQHELLLFGVRKGGSPYALRSEHKDIGTVIYGARGEHSSKPPAAMERIELRTQAPDRKTRRVEFFSRAPRPGWEGWGRLANQEVAWGSDGRQK